LERGRRINRMKKWFILFGIVAIIIGGGYFIFSFYTVKFIQPQLQKAMGPGLTLEEMKLKATYLSAKGIRYEDPHSKQKFFQIEEVRIYPSLFSLLKKSIQIRECTFLKPSLFFFRTQEGNFVGPGVAMGKGKKGKEVSEERKKRGESIPIQIDRIRIEKGSIDFEDRKMGEPPAQIRLRELDFEIREIDYPIATSHSPFELRTKMEGSKQKGNIYAKGWLDLKTSDMEISLRMQKIEVKTFEPYYRKKVSAEIEAGHMNMESKITIKQRMIDAPGQLELNDLHIRGGGTVFYIPTKTFVSLLKERGNRIPVSFHVKGNMDDPQFNLREVLLTRIAVSFAEALGFPIKVVGETIFEETGKGAGGLVEGLRSIEDLFKKKKEKKK
jgi:hypothetical protein